MTEIARLAGTADEQTTRYSYGTNARLLTETDPLGHVTRYGYDTAGRLTSITDPTSRTTTLGYDSPGRQPAWIRDPVGHQTQFGYVNGDLRSITDPLGRTTGRWVDTVGRVTAVTDPAGHTTRAVYDDANLVVKTTDPRGGDTSYRYDANGNLTLQDGSGGAAIRARRRRGRRLLRNAGADRLDGVLELREADAQRFGDGKQEAVSGVAFAALDRAEMRAVHASLVGEVLLADAERLAANADELAERVVLCGAGVGHKGGNLPELTRCCHGIYPVLEDNGLPGTRQRKSPP